MAVRKFKPVTPGQRHKVIGTFEEITASVPEKSLVFGKQVAFIVRGEVFVTSVEYGTTKQITHTPEAEEGLSFVLPFQRESVCKGKAFFRNLQIFSKFFFRKNFRKVFRRRAAYPFSLPCTSQGKILGAAVSTLSRSLSSASLSSSAALPLESGCKGTDFFLSCNFYTILFCRIFSGSCLTR